MFATRERESDILHPQNHPQHSNLPIPHRNKHLPPLIPQHTRELPTQVLREIEAVMQIQRNNNLRIRPGSKRILRLSLQPSPDSIVVVELAVDHRVDAVGGGVDGLGGGGGEVVYGETDVAERWCYISPRESVGESCGEGGEM